MVNYPYLICTLPHTITSIIYLISSQLNPNSFLYISNTIFQMHICLSALRSLQLLFLLRGGLPPVYPQDSFPPSINVLMQMHKEKTIAFI